MVGTDPVSVGEPLPVRFVLGGTNVDLAWVGQDLVVHNGFDEEAEEVAGALGGAPLALRPTLAGFRFGAASGLITDQADLERLAALLHAATRSMENGLSETMALMDLIMVHGDDVALLATLSCHAAPEVRLGVALRPTLPAALLRWLWQDPCPAVSSAVASRRSLPADAVVGRAHDLTDTLTVVDVLGAASDRPPNERRMIYEAFRTHPDAAVRGRVADFLVAPSGP